MKPWQHGYELDTLIDWANKFEHYNKYCHSPFAKAKKNFQFEQLDSIQGHDSFLVDEDRFSKVIRNFFGN